MSFLLKKKDELEDVLSISDFPSSQLQQEILEPHIIQPIRN